MRLIFYTKTFLFMLLAVGCASMVCAQGMAINEIQSANSKTIADEDGDYPDWIELYNSGSDGGRPARIWDNGRCDDSVQVGVSLR